MSIDNTIKPALATALIVVLTACTGTNNLQLDSQFPIPLVSKSPVVMGLYLDPELRTFTYNEVIEQKGEWNVAVGAVQESLFSNLATGMFQGHTLVETTTTNAADAVLKPAITDLQFSLPEQTRSDFYEVWIRYNFQLYDPAGTLVAEWPLPAYGKASKKDFGSAFKGVEAAAIAACRDAMAFFAINFSKEPKVRTWLNGKKELSATPGAET